ncbi:putative GPI-anchored protein At5g19250 [Wolffia australiana]
MVGHSARISSVFTLFLFAAAVVSLFGPAKSDDIDDELLRGINSYRAALNLTALVKNKNADCLADELAENFEPQPCSNTTGSTAIPGQDSPIADYPTLLAKCRLDISVVKEAAVLPACIPGLVPAAVLANFTKSQYNEQLNSSQYVGAGVASEGNWVVLVLSTLSPEGSLATVQSARASKGAVASFLCMFFLPMVLLLFLLPRQFR